MATGLMIVAVGRQYTKYISHFVGMDKRYETTLDLSLYTDTWDDEHREQCVKYPERDDLARFVGGLEGSHVFPLPDFSAKKV
jgi:tRNA U55 pseudouridine synthase TruB